MIAIAQTYANQHVLHVGKRISARMIIYIFIVRSRGLLDFKYMQKRKTNLQVLES